MAPSGNGEAMTVSVSPSWLSDPARVWPVVIDPTVVIGGATQDCTLDVSNQTTSECASTSLAIGGPGPGDHALLQFSLAGAVPAGAENLSATVQLYQFQAHGVVGIRESQVTRAWTNNATWDTYDGTNAWTTPGGDSTCNAPLWCGMGSIGTGVGWYSIPVNDTWLNGGPNYGLLLGQRSGLGSTGPAEVYSSDYSDPTYWPQLTVTYWMPQTGHRPFYTESGSGLSDSVALAANVESGNVTVDQSDVSMPGIGLPLEVGRTYNSWNAWSGEAGAFGVGWSMDTGQDVYLAPQPDQSVNYTAPTGFTVNYQHNADGSYTTPPGMDNTLVKNGDGTYTLTDHASQEALHFNSSGLLTSDVDRAGNTISYTYTQNPTCGAELTSITDTQGRTTSLAYDSTLCVVSSITDPAGRVSTYGYTTTSCTLPASLPHPSACLASSTDPDRHTTGYAYASGTAFVDQITDPMGNETTISYDSSTQRVSSITAVTDISTGTGLTTSFGTTGSTATVTDPNGHTTSYTFDSQSRLSSVTDANNHTAYVTWTGDDQVATTKTPSGNTTTFNYDSNNNLTETDLQNGAKTTATYNTPSSVAGYQYLPDSATDAQGNTTHYAYYSTGLVQTVTDPSGHTQSFVYDSRGRTTSETDENGHTTTHSYDATTGLPSQDTPPCPDGSTTRPCSGSQTALGITSYSFYNTNLEDTVTNGNGKVTTYTYDAMGRVTGIGYADGGSIGYSYDADGNVTAMTDATGTTTYTYNNLNQLTKKTLPNAQTISYGYDNAGNLTSKTDSGGTTAYGYDPANEVTSVTDRANRAYSVGYDQDGNMTSLGFPNGVTQQMSYNTNGQLSAISAAKSGYPALTSFSYSYTNPASGQLTLLPYTVTGTSGATQNLTFDTSNSLTQDILKSSRGAQTGSYFYGYDAAGNLTCKQSGGTAGTACASQSGKTSFSYNANNELTAASGGMTMSYTYDGNGDRVSSSDGTTYSLNAAGQITSIAPQGGSAVSMAYTGIGETQRIGRGATSYQYDGSGVNKQTDSLGDTYFTTLPDGSVLSETVPSGTYAGTYYYLSDGAGNVAALADSTGAITDSYSYDPLGNATTTGSVPNPFTFGGMTFDSATGFYYTGSGYYDPANGQSFGCQDVGWVDPGEDGCGEDESQATYCSNVAAHGYSDSSQCGPQHIDVISQPGPAGIDPVHSLRFTHHQLAVWIVGLEMYLAGEGAETLALASSGAGVSLAIVGFIIQIAGRAVEAYLHMAEIKCEHYHVIEITINTVRIPVVGGEFPTRIDTSCYDWQPNAVVY
jgi:YD repeat-containing protein